ncbi:MAG TPA: UbiA family prenyltransferase, partial [Rhabdochlamydiaceae bacterium]|nr:UbiA family prenyltransferase [Rhabdochlamydiaceae bacterium]
MSFFQVLLLAIRPKTLAASICPVLMGTAMALKTGYFDLLLFLFTLLTALGIQIGTNLSNDYFDFKKGADTAARLGPVRVTQAGLISAQSMKRLLVVNFILVALTGTILIWKGGLLFSLLIALAILFAIFYTAGPYSIAYLGLGEV